MTMLDTLNTLLKDQVRDLYNAENQLVKALPKLVKAAQSIELKTALTNHLKETQAQIERLEQVAEIVGFKPTGKKCKAMEGLVAEGAEVLEAKGEPSVIDAAIIAAAQRVEHYEISAYGSARAFAERLGLEDVAALLQQTLDEEAAADEKLSEISEESVLAAAINAGDEQEEE